MSLKAVPGRKAGTDVFFTFTVSPVLGLRAVRALRTRFSKEPKPVMATLSPLVTAFCTSLMTASSAAVADFRSPSRAASASMSSALFTVFLPNVRTDGCSRPTLSCTTRRRPHGLHRREQPSLAPIEAILRAPYAL